MKIFAINNNFNNKYIPFAGFALTALLITGICLLKGRGKQKPPTKKETLPTSKVESNNNVEPPVKPDPTSSSEPSTSHIPQKEFSQNPLEQIDEKYHYIHYEVLPLIEFYLSLRKAPKLIMKDSFYSKNMGLEPVFKAWITILYNTSG